jgi:hypothetical protein
MKGTRWMLSAAVLVVLGSAGLFAADPAGGQGSIKGEVIAVRQSVATQNEGVMTEIKVRTGQQEERWLRLGPSDEMGNRFQVGDTVHARFSGNGQGDALPVRDIKNYSTGEKMKLRDRDGTMRRDQVRDRDRDASGDRARDRDQMQDRSGAGDRHHGGDRHHDHSHGSGSRGSGGSRR